MTPVVIIIYNRPDLTLRLIEALRVVKPDHILVVADGHRPQKNGDAERCQATRACIDTIDWPCRIERIFSETNLGCGRRVSSGITEVFERVEEAIILEDDCIPHPSFLAYCDHYLSLYRDDDEVMHINGSLLLPKADITQSHGFSRYPFVWGWATWKRAWKHYQFAIPEAPSAYQAVLEHLFPDVRERYFWTRQFVSVGSKQLDTWDFQWVWAVFQKGGLAITPPVNLISNHGFREDATHTHTHTSQAELEVQALPNTLAQSPCAKAFSSDSQIFESVLWNKNIDAAYRLSRNPFLRWKHWFSNKSAQARIQIGKWRREILS